MYESPKQGVVIGEDSLKFMRPHFGLANRDASIRGPNSGGSAECLIEVHPWKPLRQYLVRGYALLDIVSDCIVIPHFDVVVNTFFQKSAFFYERGVKS